MNNSPLANSLSVSVRIYRALLVAYPKKFREHYETQMVQVFRDSLREAYRDHAVFGVIDLWLHTFVDLVFTALIERVAERSQYMFSPKIVLWGGVASIFGGLLWIMSGLAPFSAPSGTLELALVLGLGGLVSLYSRQAGQGGKLALAGFVLGIIGTAVMLLAMLWWDSASDTQSILIDVSGLAVLGIGLALLGIASLREKTLRRLRRLPLIMGLLYLLEAAAFWTVFYVPFSHGQNPWHPWNPPAYLPVFGGFFLLGLGWIGLGAMLASEGDAQIPVAQNPSTST